MYVCLWNPIWSTDAGLVGEAALLLTDRAPRLRAERDVIWADARGLDAGALAGALIERLGEGDSRARAGVAVIPIVAELAARWCSPGRAGEYATPFLVKERTGWGWRHRPPSPASSAAPSREDSAIALVERGGERDWLGGLPIEALAPAARLRGLLEGVGIRTIGDLAVLEREAVEVRFGPEAVGLWRLARADDRRLLFRAVPPERPHGSIDFVDYVLTDPARLLFTANALLGPLCDRLMERGEHARALRIILPLANGEAWERTLRPARPTASRENWLRLVRGLLERLTVPDAVTGMHLEVGATEPPVSAGRPVRPGLRHRHRRRGGGGPAGRTPGRAGQARDDRPSAGGAEGGVDAGGAGSRDFDGYRRLSPGADPSASARAHSPARGVGSAAGP